MSTTKLAEALRLGREGAPPTEAERLLFEEWMRGHCWALCATWNGTQYVHEAEAGGDLYPPAMNTRQLFAAWRDRAALASYEAAQAEEKPAELHSEALLYAGKARTMAAKLFNDPQASQVDAGDLLLYMARLVDQLCLAAAPVAPAGPVIKVLVRGSNAPLHVTGWYGDTVFVDLPEAAPAAPAPDRVPMPQNADQAAAMVSIGMVWLGEHAPDRIAEPAAPAPAQAQQSSEADEELCRQAMQRWRDAKPEAQQPLTDEQIMGAAFSQRYMDGAQYLISVGRVIEEACAQQWGVTLGPIAASKGEQA